MPRGFRSDSPASARPAAGSSHAARVAVLSLGALAGACAINPATGKQQLTFLSESQEIAMGRDADREFRATLEPYGGEALQSYVQQLGARLAAKSERPSLPWSFRLVDDPAVNAFALPGGFIYVTRGLMTHLDSEAELAAVIGHEIGHVTARHSVNQMSKAQLASVSLGLGAMLSPEIEAWGQAFETGFGLLFLKFGRDDEREADDLGLRYLSRTGYDPRPMAQVFDVLGNVSRLEGGGRLPGWLSTHPDPMDRKERIADRLRASGASFAGTTVGRDGFLERIDGMVFGENPREGFFEGNAFLHPDLKFRFELPEGWTGRNLKQAVVAQSAEKDAMIRLTLAAAASPDAASDRFLSGKGVTRGRSWRETIEGSPATLAEFDLATDRGALRGLALFLSHEGRVFELVGAAAVERWPARRGAVERSLSSFERLKDPRALAVEPARIKLVKLPSAMTLQEFSRRYPSSIPLERLAVINHAQPSERLEAGRTVKQVVGGR